MVNPFEELQGLQDMIPAAVADFSNATKTPYRETTADYTELTAINESFTKDAMAELAAIDEGRKNVSNLLNANPAEQILNSVVGLVDPSKNVMAQAAKVGEAKQRLASLKSKVDIQNQALVTRITADEAANKSVQDKISQAAQRLNMITQATNAMSQIDATKNTMIANQISRLSDAQLNELVKKKNYADFGLPEGSGHLVAMHLSERALLANNTMKLNKDNIIQRISMMSNKELLALSDKPTFEGNEASQEIARRSKARIALETEGVDSFLKYAHSQPLIAALNSGAEVIPVDIGGQTVNVKRAQVQAALPGIVKREKDANEAINADMMARLTVGSSVANIIAASKAMPDVAGSQLTYINEVYAAMESGEMPVEQGLPLLQGLAASAEEKIEAARKEKLAATPMALRAFTQSFLDSGDKVDAANKQIPSAQAALVENMKMSAAFDPAFKAVFDDIAAVGSIYTKDSKGNSVMKSIDEMMADPALAMVVGQALSKKRFDLNGQKVDLPTKLRAGIAADAVHGIVKEWAATEGANFPLFGMHFKDGIPVSPEARKASADSVSMIRFIQTLDAGANPAAPKAVNALLAFMRDSSKLTQRVVGESGKLDDSRQLVLGISGGHQKTISGAMIHVNALTKLVDGE